MYNRIVFENCYVYAGIKVEMKRRWNYKIPWPLTRFSWPLLFWRAPLKFAVNQLLVKILIN